MHLRMVQPRRREAHLRLLVLGQQKMTYQISCEQKRAAPLVDQNTVPNAGNPTAAADFSRLSGDEIERLIALCKAPAFLWQADAGPARAPEPFGMIA